MYYIPRGGTRGGADQFTWDSVKSDKDREYYLGHSLKAPVGRWQDGRDLQWFSKDRKDSESSVSDERKAIKQAEKEAMMAALGQKVVQSPPQTASSSQQNVNQPVQKSSRTGIESLSSKGSKRSQKMKDKKKKHRKERSKQTKKTKSKKKKHRKDSSSESSSESSSSGSSSSSDSEEERLKKKRKHHHEDDHYRVKNQKTNSNSRRPKHHNKASSRDDHHSRQAETDSRYKPKEIEKRKRTHSGSVDKSTKHRSSDSYRDRDRERSDASPPSGRYKSNVMHQEDTYYKRREKYSSGHRGER